MMALSSVLPLFLIPSTSLYALCFRKIANFYPFGIVKEPTFPCLEHSCISKTLFCDLESLRYPRISFRSLLAHQPTSSFTQI